MINDKNTKPDALDVFIETFDINSISQTILDLWYTEYMCDFEVDDFDGGYSPIEPKEPSASSHIHIYEPDERDSVEHTSHRKDTKINENDEYFDSDDSYTCESVVERLKDLYGMQKEQFRFNHFNGIETVTIDKIPFFWVDNIGTIIPDIGLNLNTIDEEMQSVGYKRVTTRKTKDYAGREWYIVKYNPLGRKEIRDMIRGYNMFHFSPEFNHESIMEQGLLATSGKRVIRYDEKRLYIQIARGYRIDNRFRKMMQSISSQIKKRYSWFSGIFNRYEIKQEKIDNSWKFYYDPNMQDCVYTLKDIPVDALYDKYDEFEF